MAFGLPKANKGPGGMATHWREDVDPIQWVTELAKAVEQRPPSGEDSAHDADPGRQS